MTIRCMALSRFPNSIYARGAPLDPCACETSGRGDGVRSRPSAERKIPPVRRYEWRKTLPPPRNPKEPQRIAKLLARAGVASRREIERMIEERRIAIGGVPVEK